MTAIRIDLPWTSPPISQNDRQHHHVKAKAVALALAEARMAVRVAQVEPIVGAVVTLHYRAPDRCRRDADNLAATLKVTQDALVKEGVLPDDSWVCVPKSGCHIHPPSGPPAMWVSLEEITYYEEPSA